MEIPEKSPDRVLRTADHITGAELARQIETYSNAIVAFAVLQTLAYSYSFGTNELFNCLVKTANHLAIGLIALFLFVTVLLITAMIFFTGVIDTVSGRFAGIVRKIYIGKLVAVVVFSAVPIIITADYGIVDNPGKYECKRTLG